MIQRIQTLYLSIALGITGLMLFLKLGEIAVDDKIYTFSLSGINDVVSGKAIIASWYLTVLAVTILILQAIIIFSYKMRKRQIKLIIINILLIIGLAISCWLFINGSSKSLGTSVYSFELTMVFPVVSIFFNYLAYLAIKKDDDLVKSIDRIR